MSDHPLLEINDLQVWYQTFDGYSKVLEGINLYVGRGEKIGLVGEAGCGKTTSMRAVLRILPEGQAYIPQGKILFHSQDILNMNDRELQGVRTKGISMIFQEPSAALNPVFTVGTQITDIIKYSESGKGMSKSKIKEMAIQAIKEVMIPDAERIFDCYPNQLSGGMKQRICIAMAIVTPRELLIADEPGTALDVTIQDQVHKTLKALVEKKGMSLIMITHSLGVARELADRIYVMYAGNIVEVAKAKELFSHPQHPYTLGLMASVPRLSGGGLAEGIYGQIPDYLHPPQGCRFHPRCPQAKEKCRLEKPPIIDLGGGHQVACFPNLEV